MSEINSSHEAWPSLPLEAWSETYATLHLWMQIVGKIRLAQTPWVNHSWHTTLYPTATRADHLADSAWNAAFQIDFDFLDHQLQLRSSDGGKAAVALEPQSVAAFYKRLMQELEGLDLPVTIHATPNEVADAIRFDQDETHRAYDPEYANRFWRVLRADQSRPARISHAVHRQVQPRPFLLGRARPGRHPILRPASAPASGRDPESARPGDARCLLARSEQLRLLARRRRGAYAAFYSYAYPEPAGFAKASVKPREAFYHPRSQRIRPALRGGAAVGVTGRYASRVSADDV